MTEKLFRVTFLGACVLALGLCTFLATRDGAYWFAAFLGAITAVTAVSLWDHITDDDDEDYEEGDEDE